MRGSPFEAAVSNALARKLFYHSFGLPFGGVMLKFPPEGSIK
jgi:hypothetical protein